MFIIVGPAVCSPHHTYPFTSSKGWCEFLYEFQGASARKTCQNHPHIYNNHKLIERLANKCRTRSSGKRRSIDDVSFFSYRVTTTFLTPVIPDMMCAMDLTQDMKWTASISCGDMGIGVLWVCLAYQFYSFRKQNIINVTSIEFPNNNCWTVEGCKIMIRVWLNLAENLSVWKESANTIRLATTVKEFPLVPVSLTLRIWHFFERVAGILLIDVDDLHRM